MLYAVTSAVPSEYAPRVYAVWKPVDYTVTRISAGTELDPITWNLDSPADAKVGAPIRQGYTFQGWAYSEGATKADVTADTLLKEIVVQDGERGNRTLYALWTLNTYTLTYKNGADVVNTVEWNVEMQEELTVGGGWETLTKEGFTFQGWTDEDGNEVNISVNADDAKLSIELDEENTIEIDLNAPEEDVDEALSADLEEIFNPEDGDKEDKKDDAKERCIRRRMEQRMAEFQRRQAQKRRVEAIRRVRARIERQDRRDEERKPRVGNLRRREDRRDEDRKPLAGRRVRRPMSRR